MAVLDPHSVVPSAPGMLPLPRPQQRIDQTRNLFHNFASKDDFVLIVAWLLEALRSGGPYPLLVSGEQGSATLSKLLKTLIDSNAASVQSLSHEERAHWRGATTPREQRTKSRPPHMLGTLLDAVMHGLRTV